MMSSEEILLRTGRTICRETTNLFTACISSGGLMEKNPATGKTYFDDLKVHIACMCSLIATLAYEDLKKDNES